MEKNIFRSTSLENLSSPEQLDRLLTVTNLRGWIALAATICLLIVFISWSFLGVITTRVEGKGILLSSEGIFDIVHPVSGQIYEIKVEPGDRVQKGDIIAKILIPELEQESLVISPYSGRVIEVKLNQWGMLMAGSPIASIEQSTGEVMRLEGVFYVPAEQGERIRPGMEVFLAPASIKKEDDGYMLGNVLSVTDYPVTRQAILRVLPDDDLAETFMAYGPVVEVRVGLILDSTTYSGYKWSNPKGADIKIHSGTLCSGQITISEARPIKLMLPIK